MSVVESAGEISALYFNGKYSHAVRKVPEKVIEWIFESDLWLKFRSWIHDRDLTDLKKSFNSLKYHYRATLGSKVNMAA